MTIATHEAEEDNTWGDITMSQSLWKREEKKNPLVIDRCHQFYVTRVLPGEESKHAGPTPPWMTSIHPTARSPKCSKHACRYNTRFVVQESWGWHVLNVGAEVTIRLGSGQPKFRNTNFDCRLVSCGPYCHYYSTQLLPFIRRFGALLFFSLIHTVVLLSNTHTSLYFFFDSIQFKGSSTTWICPSSHKRFPMDW